MVHIHKKVHHHFSTKKHLYKNMVISLFSFFVILSGVFALTRGANPHTSELAFIEHSSTGVGSVMPASCDSVPPVDHFVGDCFSTCTASPASPQVGDVVTWTVSPIQADYINNGLEYVSEILSGPDTVITNNTNYGSLPSGVTTKAITYSSPGVQYTMFTDISIYSWMAGSFGNRSHCLVNVTAPPPPPTVDIHFQ